MHRSEPKIIPRLFLFFLGVFIFLLFVLLGKEPSSGQEAIRLILGGVLFVWVLVECRLLPGIASVTSLPRNDEAEGGRSQKKLPKAAVLFFVFCLFQAGRAVYAGLLLKFGGITAVDTLTRLGLYGAAPLRWASYFAIFFVFYTTALKKSRALVIFRVFCWSAFLLALNALPPLLQLKQDPIYSFAGSSGFFLPFFYHYKWLGDYIFSYFTHVNIFGDILNLGLFPALGLALYALHLRTLDKRELLPSDAALSKGLPFVLMRLLMAAVIFSAILLVFSRGTMISVTLAGFIFMSGLGWKLFKKKNLFFLLLVIAGLVLGMAVWAGNLSKAVGEVFTLTNEHGQEGTSSYVNRRAKEISFAMVHDNKMLGVGLKGYPKFSTRYDSQWKQDSQEKGYHYAGFNHYLTILCEEGLIGGSLYFLFLIVWLSEVFWRILTTKSYFKFVAGFSFVCSVITVLIHSCFNSLMQLYGTASLVYAAMGISLGILSKSFQHAE